MRRFSPVILLCAFFLLNSSGSIGSPASDEVEEHDRDDTSQSGLPAWEEGESGESFDIRIWPESVMIWLEHENLRDLIADPATPASEKEELKRILAMQRAWRVSDAD